MIQPMKYLKHLYSLTLVLALTTTLNATESLSLQEAIEKGLKNSIAKQKQHLTLSTAKSQILEVASGALPSVRGEIAYSKMESFQTKQFTESLNNSGFGALFDKIDELTTATGIDALNFDASSSSSVQHSYTNKVVFSQTLFNGQLLPAYAGAKQYLKIQENTLALLELELTVAITQSYFNVQQYQTQVEVAKKSRDAFKQHQLFVEKRREAGLATKAEVLLSQSAVSESEQRVLNSVKGLAIATLELKHLVQVPININLKSKFKVPKSPLDYDPKTLYTTALLNRIDFDSQKRLIGANEKSLSVVKRSGWPKVVANGSYGYGSSQKFTTSEDNTDWFIGVSGTLDFFTGFHKTAKKTQAINTLKASQLDKTLLEQKLEKDTVEAHLNYKIAQKALQTASTQKALNKEVLDLEKLGYENGSTALRDLLQAESDFANAKLTYTQTAFMYIMSYLHLEYTLGTLTLNKVLSLEEV